MIYNEAWNSLSAWYNSWFPVEEGEIEGLDEEEETCDSEEEE